MNWIKVKLIQAIAWKMMKLIVDSALLNLEWYHSNGSIFHISLKFSFHIFISNIMLLRNQCYVTKKNKYLEMRNSCWEKTNIIYMSFNSKTQRENLFSAVSLIWPFLLGKACSSQVLFEIIFYFNKILKMLPIQV